MHPNTVLFPGSKIHLSIPQILLVIRKPSLPVFCLRMLQEAPELKWMKDQCQQVVAFTNSSYCVYFCKALTSILIKYSLLQMTSLGVSLKIYLCYCIFSLIVLWCSQNRSSRRPERRPRSRQVVGRQAFWEGGCSFLVVSLETKKNSTLKTTASTSNVTGIEIED